MVKAVLFDVAGVLTESYGHIILETAVAIDANIDLLAEALIPVFLGEASIDRFRLVFAFFRGFPTRQVSRARPGARAPYPYPYPPSESDPLWLLFTTLLQLLPPSFIIITIF